MSNELTPGEIKNYLARLALAQAGVAHIVKAYVEQDVTDPNERKVLAEVVAKNLDDFIAISMRVADEITSG